MMSIRDAERAYRRQARRCETGMYDTNPVIRELARRGELVMEAHARKITWPALEVLTSLALRWEREAVGGPFPVDVERGRPC